MGYKYEVLKWVRLDGVHQYVQAYAGDSLLAALVAMYKSRKAGSGCVNLLWR